MGGSVMNNERNPQVTPIQIGTISTSSGLSSGVVVPGIYMRKRSRIKNVYFVNNGAVAKSNSNYLSLLLQDNSATPVAYASAATSAAAVVQNTQYPLALQAGGGSGDDTNSASQPEVDVPAGTMLNASIAALGSAVPTNGILLVEWYPL
jgi:hypothetical protein